LELVDLLLRKLLLLAWVGLGHPCHLPRRRAYIPSPERPRSRRRSFDQWIRCRQLRRLT
jgi:hypothetical protein